MRKGRIFTVQPDCLKGRECVQLYTWTCTNLSPGINRKSSFLCPRPGFLFIFDILSLEYNVNSIILDIANCRMFKPVNSDIPNESRKFLNMKFANKGIDAINIGNILNHRDVVKNIPPYFKCQTTPKISYTYTNSIASTILNYKQSLRDFKLNEHASQPHLCSCSSSTYLYSPAGHVVTENLNIVENLKLRDILSKGPKYREPTTFSWKYNFKLVMDSVEDYARRWAK